MVGWHHQLNGHEFEQTLGNSEGQRDLVHCSPWGSESDTTEWLNNICLTWSSYYHLLCQTLSFTGQLSTLFFLAASFYRQWKRLVSIPLVSRGGILFILFKLLVHYWKHSCFMINRANICCMNDGWIDECVIFIISEKTMWQDCQDVFSLFWSDL